MLTVSLILMPAAAVGLLMHRLAANPFLRVLGTSLENWADASRAGSELS